MRDSLIGMRGKVTLDDYEFSSFAQGSYQLDFRNFITQNMIYSKEMRAGLTPEMLSYLEYGTDEYWDIIVMLNASSMDIGLQNHIYVSKEAERLSEKWNDKHILSSKKINPEEKGLQTAQSQNEEKRKVAFLRKEYIPLIVEKYRNAISD